MMRFGKLVLVVGLLLCVGAVVVPAYAGTVILEGSDAIGLHSPFNASAAAYRDQTWSAIGGADARPIAFIGDSLAGMSSGTHTISKFSSVAAAGTLGNYVALYFQAGSGCCSENDGLVTAVGAAAAVGAYLAGGGTVMIGNYTGGHAWDFAVGTDATHFGHDHVAGSGGGLTGSTCSDGEKVSATGLLNGFTQPGPIGCWTHQGYDQAGFFAGLGFTKSFFDAGVDYPAGFSSLLSSGSTVSAPPPGPRGVPEPASLLLLGTGLVGLVAIARRRRQR